ncbi:MAG: flagellar basal body P-ring formation chaperone FlgA [Thermodesulfobacteriota bacterium]|nr:flagellar basal body P-ring formation chaperone FlgA [Thermodesulfobacteriota bacterium]
MTSPSVKTGINHIFKHPIPLVVLGLLVLAIPGCLYAESITSINVYKKTTVEKDEILLGKIADIESEDHVLLDRLKNIVIGRSPLPGKSRYLGREYIKLRLKQNDIEFSRLALKIPEKIKVSRGFVKISREEIQRIVIDYIYEKQFWDEDNARITDIQIAHIPFLPKGKISYKVVPPKTMQGKGTIPLSILFLVDGEFYKKVKAVAKIKLFKEVVVTKKPLGRYRTITQEDVYMQKMDITNLPNDIITNYKDALGKRVRRNIWAKVVLRAEHIEFPPLVKRGDTVLIVAESEKMKITALGEVRKAGRRGERVKVVNLNSNKRIFARIIDENTVKVEF